MINIATYVPYIYRSSNVKNIKKIYDKIENKQYSDFVNFFKGLYIYLCNNPNRCDNDFQHVTNYVFHQWTGMVHGSKEWEKRDLCLVMLLFIKCKKECGSSVLKKEKIEWLHSCVGNHVDMFDEEDFSTILTFLNFTSNRKLYYCHKNKKENDMKKYITREIIRRSDYYVDSFKQLKNLCILYSYLCRENISVQLNSIILKKIFQNVDQCKGTDLTNLIFNLYYINSCFFKRFLRQIMEAWNFNKDAKEKEETGDITNGNVKKKHTKNSIQTIMLDGNKYNKEGYVMLNGESNYLHKINGANVFNIYNCNIYMFYFIRAYNKICAEGKIEMLNDKCNYVDNIWKNCRLMYEFYTSLKELLHKEGGNLNGGIVNVTNKETILHGKEIGLYSSISDTVLNIYLHVYKNGLNYYQYYFNECREFLKKYILDMLKCTHVKKEKNENMKEKKDDGNEELKSEHVTILLNVLNQINVQDVAIYHLFIDHFKKGAKYSMKTTLEIVQFLIMQNMYKIHATENTYYMLLRYFDKMLDTTILRNAPVINNFGFIFVPLFFFFSKDTYMLYKRVFIKSAQMYLQKKEHISSTYKKKNYNLNDELLYFGLCYNVLMDSERPHTFFTKFPLRDLQKIRNFLQEFEYAIKTNCSKAIEKRKQPLPKVTTARYCDHNKKIKKIKVYYFMLSKSVVTRNKNITDDLLDILKYIDFCFNQRKDEYINFFHLFKLYHRYMHIYENYESRFYAPSVAPSIIIQK